MQVYPDIVGFLGDENRDSGDIRLGLSDATIATSQTIPPTPINYLDLSSIQPSSSASTLESQPSSTVPMTDTASKVDVQESLPRPTKKLSEEETPSDKSEETNDNGVVL